MKSTFVSIIALIVSTNSICQYASPEVTAASGGSFESTTLQLSWTLGEPIINLLQGSSAQVSCGFHQTDSFCFGDFNFDGEINTNDILILLGEWNCQGICLADMDEDGQVGTPDILLLLGTFGNSCFNEIL